MYENTVKSLRAVIDILAKGWCKGILKYSPPTGQEQEAVSRCILGGILYVIKGKDEDTTINALSEICANPLGFECIEALLFTIEPEMVDLFDWKQYKDCPPTGRAQLPLASTIVWHVNDHHSMTLPRINEWIERAIQWIETKRAELAVEAARFAPGLKDLQRKAREKLMQKGQESSIKLYMKPVKRRTVVKKPVEGAVITKTEKVKV